MCINGNDKKVILYGDIKYFWKDVYVLYNIYIYVEDVLCIYNIY